MDLKDQEKTCGHAWGVAAGVAAVDRRGKDISLSRGLTEDADGKQSDRHISRGI